jgi:hypothetical protein
VHFLEIYILDHLGFLPIEILVVTIVIGGMLEYRDKTSRLQKMNMVIGTFFSEVGRELLSHLSLADTAIESKIIILKNIMTWTKKDFQNARKQLLATEGNIDYTRLDLPHLKERFLTRRGFLLRLMENPNLLEHDQFTNLMQAAFHLLEELQFRNSFDDLPKADYDHLAGDAKRVYLPLLLQWLDHMTYLKDNYPYLFSLAARTNPFDADSSVILSD